MRALPLALLLLASLPPLAAAGPVLSCDLYATAGSGTLGCGLPVDAGWNLCPPGAQCRFVPLLVCHVDVPGRPTCASWLLP